MESWPEEVVDFVGPKREAESCEQERASCEQERARLSPLLIAALQSACCYPFEFQIMGSERVKLTLSAELLRRFPGLEYPYCSDLWKPVPVTGVVRPRYRVYFGRKAV